MRYIALVMLCCGLYFIQAQLLPAIFHTSWLPNCILTAVILVTIFKGRKTGLIAAVIGGSIHDILISNFFGLHLFPYIIVVYLLSFVKSHVYEERWYWSCAIVGICTLIDGIVQYVMISSSGGDIIFFSYIGHMVMPTVFWNAVLGGIGHFLMGLTEEKEDYIW